MSGARIEALRAVALNECGDIHDEGRPNLAPRDEDEACALLALAIAGAARILPNDTVASLARVVADLADSMDLDEALRELADSLEG